MEFVCVCLVYKEGALAKKVVVDLLLESFFSLLFALALQVAALY